VIVAAEGTVQLSHLPINLQSRTPAQAEMRMAAGAAGAIAPVIEAPAAEGEMVRLPIGTTVEDAERSLILRTLEHMKNNKTRAAEVLGISLKTLHNKLKEYGVRGAAVNP
jgi:DNA-binding NtrC family response regulator